MAWWWWATPIGNLDDLAPRAAARLRDADVVACEDTRRSAVLLRHAGADDADGAAPRPQRGGEGGRVLRAWGPARRVALVSDAGMPLVSDPGARLVRAAVEEGLPVTVVPGPSAVTAALALSGLAEGGGFHFAGFAPRSAGERRAFAERLEGLDVPAVVFESPNRLPGLLRELAERWPDRPAAVLRELTKLHEEALRGTLAELAERLYAPPKGEVVLVLGAAPAAAPGEEDAGRLREALGHMLDAGSAPAGRRPGGRARPGPPEPGLPRGGGGGGPEALRHVGGARGRQPRGARQPGERRLVAQHQAAHQRLLRRRHGDAAARRGRGHAQRAISANPSGSRSSAPRRRSPRQVDLHARHPGAGPHGRPPAARRPRRRGPERRGRAVRIGLRHLQVDVPGTHRRAEQRATGAPRQDPGHTGRREAVRDGAQGGEDAREAGARASLDSGSWPTDASTSPRPSTTSTRTRTSGTRTRRSWPTSSPAITGSSARTSSS